MSTHIPDSAELARSAAEPHDVVLQALETDPLAAVAWTSAHLVAVDQVLYAAMRRRVRGSRPRLRLARKVDRDLQRAVCRLDRRLTGDHHLAELPVEQLADEVRACLHEHAQVERTVLDALAAELSVDDLQQLAARLTVALATAPTRPHPHTRHTPLSGLVARIDAEVDRARDLMDNRVVDTGRPRRAVRPLGRWGAYLTGTPYASSGADRPR
jgi:hypothetical protein